MATSGTLVPAHSGDHWGEGLRNMRVALDRFETLLALGLGVTVLGFLLRIAQAGGVTPRSNAPIFTLFGVQESFSYGTAIAVLVGVSTAVLVLVGLVVVLLGFLAWRRGIWSLRKARSEVDPENARAIDQSLQDAHRVVLAFIGLIALAVAIGVALGATDAALYLAGAPLLSSAVLGAMEGFGTGGMIYLAYLYGTRHLVGALGSRLPEALRAGAREYQQTILLGAVLGWAASVASIFWPFQVLSVAGLACLLFGIHRFKSVYDVSLRGTGPQTLPLSRPAPSS